MTSPGPDWVALEGAVAGALSSTPDAAATLKYDLHAILNGWPTLTAYAPEVRARIRLALGLITPEELTELIGPPVA